MNDKCDGAMPPKGFCPKCRGAHFTADQLLVIGRMLSEAPSAVMPSTLEAQS